MEVKNFLNKHKVLISVILGLIVIFYLAFLFVVPNVINLNNYKKDIQKLVSDTTMLNLDFDNLKIVTTADLKAGVNIENAALSYANGKKIASVKDAEVKIAVLPLIFKTLRVTDISAANLEANVTLQKDGQVDIVRHMEKVLAENSSAADTDISDDLSEDEDLDMEMQEFPVKFSYKLPVVKINNYLFVLNDEKNAAALNLKGDTFVFDEAVLNKHFRVSSSGKFLLNGKENVLYNFRVKTFWPAVASSQDNASSGLPDVDFVKALLTYNPKADIEADLILKEHLGHTDINGYINADRLSVKLNGKKLPDSYFHLKSDGHNSVVESDIYVGSDEKAEINGVFSHAHNTKIDLAVKSDRISFESIKEFALAVLNSLNISNDIDSVIAKGFIKADFKLKTDLKKFESQGDLNIVDGFISHKTVPVKIDKINADVDFSGNSVDIKNAIAYVNGEEIKAKGTIKEQSNAAVADISVYSAGINISPLFNAFAPVEIKNAYSLKSGIVNFSVNVKGKLNEIKPVVEAGLKNAVLKTKAPMPLLTVSCKDVKISADTTDIKIIPFDILLNNSKISVSGGVYDYLKKMKIDIKADGYLQSNDLKNLLPKEAAAFAGAKGRMPLYAFIKGNDKKIESGIQAYTDANNHFSPVTVKKMIGKSGLVNIYAVLSGDKLLLEDASLYQSSKATFTKDFVSNKKGAKKVAGINGEISGLSTAYPDLQLNFSVPDVLVLSSAVMPDAKLTLRGDLSVSGYLNNLSNLFYKGYFFVKDVSVPDFLTKIQDADIEFNDQVITAKIQNLDINGTSFNIDADASSKFTSVFGIKTLKVSSANFDADKLFAAMDKINKSAAMQSSSAVGSSGSSSGLALPVKIADGDLYIQKFKMKQAFGLFEASDISSDFTLYNDLFTLKNFKASVYGGNVTGLIKYNVATTQVNAKINGSKINANPAISVFTGLKDQVVGNADFDADIKLKGADYEQQMKSLNGKVNFSLKDGQMGSLGRFETFLKADNLLSQSFVSTKIGSLVSTVAPYNTGKFAYLKGDIDLKNGVAFLAPVQMSGPHMSLLLNGNVNILSLISNIEILGSLSPEVTKSLGPVADLSVEKFASFIPKFGAKIASALNTYNAAANKSVLEKIPALTPEKTNTKSFKVLLNGNLNNPTGAIKRFQWLNTPEKIEEEQAAIEKSLMPSLPVTKEELKEQIKEDVKQGVTNALQNNEKVQEIQQNKAVKTLGEIYKFYKKSGSTETQE